MNKAQRRRREIFVEQNKKGFEAPAGAASSAHTERVHVNPTCASVSKPAQDDFLNMPLLTELEFFLEWVSTNISHLRRWALPHSHIRAPSVP
jgi:hypothetical protein